MRSFTLLKSSDHRTIVILLLVLLLLQGVPQHLFHPGIEHDRAEFHHTEFHLDPDTADWPEFALLPGIGEKLAKAIVLYRNENSGFKRLENLQEVK